MRRLTPQEFRGLVKARGYTLADVADLWGLTPTRLSQIAKDRARAAHYDYALWGVPPRRGAAAVAIRREQAARKYAAPDRSGRESPPPKVEDVWTELTSPGAVFVVRDEQGEHLPQGCEGVVIARERRGDELRITLRFASGYSEAFDLSYLRAPECFLAATGRQAGGEPFRA